VLGQIGSLLGRVEFQLHASNVCLINSYVKPHFGWRRSVGAFSPPAFSPSQSHREHRGVSECPRVNISTQTPSVPWCLRERPLPLNLLFILFLLPSCLKNPHSDSRRSAEVAFGRG
jgi:hypothetical protein